MYYEEFVKLHANKVDMVQEQLFNVQMDLIKAYERQWAEMNYLIETRQWDEKAIYLANAYGLKIDDEMYAFQLSAPLPFLPNSYYMRFKKSKDEFMTAKLLISAQLRDVINQLGIGLMQQPAALLIKHYYNGNSTRIFDLDNKSKQVVINTFRQKLILDDNVKKLPFYSEEAIQGDENRTMLYLGPYSKRIYMEEEITLKYPRIDHLPESVEGEYPSTFFPICSSVTDNIPEQGNVTFFDEEESPLEKLDKETPFM